VAVFKDLTTLHCGGLIERLVYPANESELLEIVQPADTDSFLAMGNGSNLLASEQIFDGVVVKYVDAHIEVSNFSTHERNELEDVSPLREVNSLSKLSNNEHSEFELVRNRFCHMQNSQRLIPAPAFLDAGAGANWDDLVQSAVSLGSSGYAALSGIPGTVGGVIAQNAGAFGSEISDLVISVRAFNRIEGKVRTFTADQLSLGYRTSGFKKNSDWIIISAKFFLLGPASPSTVGFSPTKTVKTKKGSARPLVVLPENELSASAIDEIKYQSLAEHLGVAIGDYVSSSQVREAVLELRKIKGVLYDPHDPTTFSAGSFFKNPQVAGRKISAAQLIAQSGIKLGFTLDGKVQISDRNLLVIVNPHSSPAESVLELARYVMQQVSATTGIQLEPEVQLINF
jgi:UDP-N-acetylmuramate dehydrogenase